MREYRTAYHQRKRMKLIRAKRKADAHCVNHTGRPATHGCRCEDCHIVHKYGKRRAMEMTA